MAKALAVLQKSSDDRLKDIASETDRGFVPIVFAPAVLSGNAMTIDMWGARPLPDKQDKKAKPLPARQELNGIADKVRRNLESAGFGISYEGADAADDSVSALLIYAEKAGVPYEAFLCAGEDGDAAAKYAELRRFWNNCRKFSAERKKNKRKNEEER